MQRVTYAVNKIRACNPITIQQRRNMSTSEPVKQAIQHKLSTAFKPVHLEVWNESYMHSVPPGSETHFKVIVVSESFDKQSIIARHRLINQTLAEELRNGVHALSIVAKSPEQWSQSQQVAESPSCLGGRQHEARLKADKD